MQAQSELTALAISKFSIPGEAGFPLNSVYAKPSNTSEVGKYDYFIYFHDII